MSNRALFVSYSWGASIAAPAGGNGHGYCLLAGIGEPKTWLEVEALTEMLAKENPELSDAAFVPVFWREIKDDRP